MYHFIVNPVSRSGKGLVLWQKKIEPILKKKNIPYRVEYTKQRGNTTELCRKISDSEKNEFYTKLELLINSLMDGDYEIVSVSGL